MNYTAFSFFIKGSYSDMKNNTDYLDTHVTFERGGGGGLNGGGGVFLGANFTKLIQ